MFLKTSSLTSQGQKCVGLATAQGHGVSAKWEPRWPGPWVSTGFPTSGKKDEEIMRNWTRNHRKVILKGMLLGRKSYINIKFNINYCMKYIFFKPL